MKIISFGGIEIDYYFKNDLFIGYNIGGCAYNTLVNLSIDNEVTYYYVGNTYEITSPINLIKLSDGINKRIFKIEAEYTNICPYCNRLSKYEKYNIDNIPITKDDVIILDDINDHIYNLLNKFDNNKHLIIKYVSNISSFNLDEIIKYLNMPFKSIILSKNVYSYIRSKFKIDYDDLFNMINTEALIIFNDKEVIIETKDDIYEKEIEEKVNVSDRIGALEAFYSSFITNLSYTEKTISMCFIKGMINYQRCVSLDGPYSHIQRLNKSFEYDECVCNKFI